MLVALILTKLLALGSGTQYTNSSEETQPYSHIDGFFLRRCGSTVFCKNQYENQVCELNAFLTMPKRMKLKTPQKLKRARQTLSDSNNKRTSIPRHCKSSTTSKESVRTDFDCLHTTSNKTFLGANQVKKNSKKEKYKIEEKEEVASMSSDDVDVVFDLQEDKKNRVYEVINVMSDDETPNQITYERLYADEPEKKVARESEVPVPVPSTGKEVVKSLDSDDSTDIYGFIDVLSDGDIVNEIAKEASFISEKLKEKDMCTSKKTNGNKEKTVAHSSTVKDDSDDEVVCVAVLDPKTKTDPKKTIIEEICLSSDSETDCTPIVPPIKLKLPFNNYPNCVNGFLESETSGHFYGSNSSNLNFNFRRTPFYPYMYGHKSTSVESEWDSFSTSPKATSSDEFSPNAPESPAVAPGTLSENDNSSNTGLSESSPSKQKSSVGSHNDYSSPASSSSDEEEPSIYWKADRELRRKAELRHEEYTEFGKKVHEGEAEIDQTNTLAFKVMSYNVLAQNLLEEHRFLYKNHDHRALGWAKRWALIYSEIQDENPEILCLQEVEQLHLESQFSKLQEMGYKSLYKKRTNNYQDGVAIFYKSALFEAESESCVEFYQPGVSVLDRDNVGVVIRLRVKKSPRDAIVIATTHLLYNPRRSDVKLAQVQLLLAEIDRVAYNKNALTYYPIIMTGDFNLRPSNGVYRLVTEGLLLYEGMSRRTLRTPDDQNTLPRTLLPSRLGVTDRCQHVDVLEARVRGEDAVSTKLYHTINNRDPTQDFSFKEDSKDDRFESGTLFHGFNFKSVYEHTKGEEKEASTHHDRWITVDYIFYSSPKVKEGEESSLQLLSRLRLPTQSECDRFIRHIPNFAFGSDHLPLVAKFLLRLH